MKSYIKETNKNIEYAYNKYKNYNEYKDLKEMCNKCECYCGKEHNYEECRNNNCFRFYLAYKYLLYLNTIEEIF